MCSKTSACVGVENKKQNNLFHVPTHAPVCHVQSMYTQNSYAFGFVSRAQHFVHVQLCIFEYSQLQNFFHEDGKKKSMECHRKHVHINMYRSVLHIRQTLTGKSFKKQQHTIEASVMEYSGLAESYDVASHSQENKVKQAPSREH